jgi:hypothetical protein
MRFLSVMPNLYSADVDRRPPSIATCSAARKRDRVDQSPHAM